MLCVRHISTGNGKFNVQSLWRDIQNVMDWQHRVFQFFGCQYYIGQTQKIMHLNNLGPCFYYVYMYVFCRAIVLKFGPAIGRWTLFFLVSSCGMYIAAPALLPSSFTMYLGMVAMGAWFQQKYEVSRVSCTEMLK